MNAWPEHVSATTWHGRHGAVRHSFRYHVDYVLIDPETTEGPRLFSRNRWNLASVRDRDHGGTRGSGTGAAWARQVLADRGLSDWAGCRIRLLTQPRFLGYVFNPVSFWLAHRGDDLVAVIAEVNNTYGDRHSYVCHQPDFGPIRRGDVLTAAKVFHVSPFQEIAGGYQFTFDMDMGRIAFRIVHQNGAEGITATLAGRRQPLTNGALLRAALRLPPGAIRAVVLIYWQALRLAMKGARFQQRPAPPAEEIT